MIRVAFLLIVVFALVSVGIFLVTRLVVFWRNKLWDWKLEKEEHKKKRLREAEQEFIDSTKMFDESHKESEK